MGEEGSVPRPSGVLGHLRAEIQATFQLSSPTPFDLVSPAVSVSGRLCCVTWAGLLASLASYFTFWR